MTGPSDRSSLTPGTAPEWSREASPLTAFARGLPVALTIPGVILFASSAGFGALARDGGLSLANAVVMMAILYALPAQVVLVDQMARGASLTAGALAVALTGVRLLPMTVALMPYLRGTATGRWRYLLAAHFIAVTGWMEGWRRLPHLPAHLRLSHFIGIGTGLCATTLAGTAMGYEVSGSVPALIAAVLLFLTPLYFMLSLIATAGSAANRLAIVSGAVIGPPIYLLAPGLDLLATGLIGGTLAHLIARRL